MYEPERRALVAVFLAGDLNAHARCCAILREKLPHKYRSGRIKQRIEFFKAIGHKGGLATKLKREREVMRSGPESANVPISSGRTHSVTSPRQRQRDVGVAIIHRPIFQTKSHYWEIVERRAT